MEKTSRYWFDYRYNKWDNKIFTEEKAEECSKSLIDCCDCRNCFDCKSCDNCISCECCDNCINCIGCYKCWNSEGCKYCRRCFNCSYCNSCLKCKNCRNLIDCKSLIEQPQIYTTPKIGSRYRETYFYYGFVICCDEIIPLNAESGERSLQVSCGCFHGDLKEFEDKVVKTHKHGTIYRNQYLKEIEKVKALFKLEGEK